MKDFLLCVAFVAMVFFVIVTASNRQKKMTHDHDQNCRSRGGQVLEITGQFYNQCLGAKR